MEAFPAGCQVLVIPPVWFLLSTAHPGLPVSPWMRSCSFLLHRATGQVPHAPLSCPFLGSCPPCSWSQICSAAVANSKQQLTGIDGWGLLLHLFIDKCFNLSLLRNHIDWRDFVLFPSLLVKRAIPPLISSHHGLSSTVPYLENLLFSRHRENYLYKI